VIIIRLDFFLPFDEPRHLAGGATGAVLRCPFIYPRHLSRPTGKRLAIPGWSNVVKKLFRRGMIPGFFLDLSRLERLLALQIGKHQLA